MIKLIFMLKRREDLSSEEFRALYEGSHVAMARQWVGHLLESYTRNYILETAAPPTESDAAILPFQYDVVTEMVLKDQRRVDEMLRIFGSDEAAPLFVADEARMFDRRYTLMLRCEEIDTGTTL